MLFNGFDSTAGQALSCVVNSGVLILLLVENPPEMALWRRIGPALGLIAAAIAWGVLATLQDDWSLPDYAGGKLLSLMSGVAALLCGLLLARREGAAAALLDWLLLVNGAILLAGLAVWEAGTGAASYWHVEREGRFLGPIGNANVTAAVAAGFAIIAFARLARPQRIPVWAKGLRASGQMLYLPLLVVCLGAMVLTASRFTSVALVLLMAPFAADWVSRWRRPAYQRWIAGGLALSVLAIIAGLSALLRSRFGTLSAGLGDRQATWAHLSDVVAASPVFGYGLGSFSTVHAHFLTTPRFAQATWTINSAHNLILQLLIQGGWPYALMLGGAALLIALQVGRALRRRRTDEDLIILAVIALILACSMVDVTLDMPCTVSLTLLLAGLLWGGSLDRPKIRIADARRQPADHERLVGGRGAGERHH